MNRICLVGNNVRDIELKSTPGGTAVCTTAICVNRRYTTASGEKREESMFIDCEAWGKSAEILHQYVKKGDRIAIEGHLKLDAWEDKESGKKRSKHKVVIDNFTMLGSKPKQDDQPAEQRQEPEPNYEEA